MKELENLLASLVQRGRKPWGIGSDTIYIHSTRDGKIILECPYLTKSYRDLISLESGFWQFVVENKLFNKNLDTRTRASDNKEYDIYDCQFRLLESSLIPEEELGKFLVENIVVE